MNIGSVSIVFLGVIILYAGVLSLATDLYVGVGMMIAGGVLVVIPLWRFFVPSRKLQAVQAGMLSRPENGREKGI